MQPHAVMRADVRDRAQGLDRTHVHRPELGHHAERQIAPGPVLGQHAVQGAHVHGEVGPARHEAHRVAPEVQHVRRARDRDVPFVVRHVDEEAALPRGVLQAPRGGVVGGDVPQRGQEGGEVGHRAARDEDSARVLGITDEARDPAQALALDLGGRGPELPRPGVGVRAGGQRFREHADHRPRPVHVGEVPGRADRGEMRRHALAPVRDERLRRLAFLRQLPREPGRDLGRAHVGEHGAAIQMGVVVGDGLHDLAPDPAQRAQVDVARPRRLRLREDTRVRSCGEGSAFRLPGTMGLLSRSG